MDQTYKDNDKNTCRTTAIQHIEQKTKITNVYIYITHMKASHQFPCKDS